MKEKYFTHENIYSESMKMLRKLSNSHGSRKNYKIGKNTALLIIDMQNYFLEEDSHAFVASAHAIIPGIKSLIHACQKKGLPVIFTKHTNNDENAGSLSGWWNDLIRENTRQCGIYTDFKTDDSIIIEKHQYDAFYQTELNEILKKLKINQVIVTGVLTHLCCETTVRSAFVNGYDILFPINGTATYNKKYHKNSLVNLSHGFAVPVLMEDIITKIEKL